MSGIQAMFVHRHSSVIAMALGASLLSGCIPSVPDSAPLPTPAPAPAPAPSPVPTPAPPPPPPPPENWMDAPQTPGDWSYTPAAGGGTASFGAAGTPLLTLRCDGAGQAVEIALPGGGPAGPVRILTEFGNQIVQSSPAQGASQTTVARISAYDRLLDWMAFSKGRFAVEVAGRQTLYVPAWPEVTRVVEDCR